MTAPEMHSRWKIWSLRIPVWIAIGAFLWMNFDAYRSMRVFYASGGADFKIYRTAAAILKQTPQKLYDYGEQARVQQALYPLWPVGNDPLPYNHFPAEAVMFLPLAGLSDQDAYFVWQAVNLLLMVFSLWMIRGEIDALWKLFRVPPEVWALTFFPVIMGLFHGQDAIILLFFFTLSFWLTRRGWDWIAGFSVGLCTIKPHLAIPFALLFFFCRRRWRGAFGFMVGGALIAIASLVMVGWQGVRSFTELNLLTQQYHPWLFNAGLMANIRGLLQAASQPALGAQYTVWFILLLSAFCFIKVAQRMWGLPATAHDQAGSGLDLEYSIALITACAVSYHLYPYDLSVLLPPVFLMLNRLCAGTVVNARVKWSMLICMVILFILPLHLLGISQAEYKLFAVVYLVLIWCAAKLLGENHAMLQVAA